MPTKRLPSKDLNGWPYCPWCRKQEVLVLAAPDEGKPEQPTLGNLCEDHRRRRTDDMRLSWEEYLAGLPCRGCGLPYRADEPWSGSAKGTMYYTEEERAAHDAEAARFRAAHPDCHAIRHSVQGSVVQHCGRCCPPPPLSPEQWQKIVALLMRPRPAALTS